jgi:hypothetical protein
MLYPINDFEFELNTRINNTIMLSGKYIVKGSSIVKFKYIIITVLRNPIHSQAYINIEITHNIIILSLHIRL